MYTILLSLLIGGNDLVVNPMPGDYLFAQELLTSPVLFVRESDFTPELVIALKEVSIDLQILDPLQVRHFFSASSLEALDILRQNYISLMGQPKAEQLKFIPHRTRIQEGLAFNRIYNDRLELYLKSNPDWEEKILPVIQENKRLRMFWEYMHGAATDFQYIPVRRMNLKRAIDMIGEEDFYNNNYPPFVPIWRFTEE